MTPFVIALAVSMWLPGHLALRLSGGSKPRRTDRSATERVFAEISLSALLLIWVAVTLAMLGLLTPFALIGCVAVPTLVMTGAVWKTAKPLWRLPSFRADGVLVVVILLAGVAGWLYQPKFEQIIGGRDPVTYMVSGIHTARSGSWVVDDEVVRSLGDAERRSFLGPDQRETQGHWGPRFLGWYLMDADTGRVVPQGLPLYPATIALGYLVGDVEGALYTTTALAIAAVIALFFLGSRLLNPAAGFVAAGLLLVSPSQVWFSRFATAESVAQWLFVVGLYGLVVFRRHGGWGYGALAAIAFGLSWQAHIWMIWLLLPLLGILLFDLVSGRLERKAILAFWAPLCVLGVQALVVYATVTTAYLWGVYKVLRWSTWALIPAVVALAGILGGVWFWRRRTSSGHGSGPADGSSAPGWMRRVLAGVIVSAAVYGYWIRPLDIYTWRAESVLRLTLATTLAVFGFAVAGAVLLLLNRRRGDATMCFLAVSLGIIVPILYEPNIHIDLMWALRRYHTFLPLIFLFAAVPLWIDRDRPGQPLLQRRTALAVGTVVSVLLVAQLSALGLQYRGFRQPGHGIADIEAIVESVEDDAVLIFEARSGWGELDFVAPLAYWKGLEVVWFRAKEVDAATLTGFVRRKTQRGRPVYYVTQGFNYYISEPPMVPHKRFWFDRTELELVPHRLPEVVRSSSFPMSIYKFEIGGESDVLDGILDVGYWDDNYVGEALPWETSGDFTARWTKGVAFFWLPGLPSETREITVHANTIFASESLGRTLSARLDGTNLGEILITADWTDYVFEVPSDWQPTAGAVPKLELSTEPLQPDAVTGNGDTRYLGVLVNAILWR